MDTNSKQTPGQSLANEPFSGEPDMAAEMLSQTLASAGFERRPKAAATAERQTRHDGVYGIRKEWLRTNGVEILNPNGKSNIILTCDHAGNMIPPHLDQLGIGERDLKRHIAWDVGAADVTRHLAQAWDAPAIFQHVSRLVIDVNRTLDHPSSIPPVSDQSRVPGNENLSSAERSERQRRYFWDYHLNVDAMVARMRAMNQTPVLLFIHSFAEQLDLQGEKRPWHVGVLHGKDRSFSTVFMEELHSAFPDLMIGDDEPYKGASSGAFSHMVHAEDIGLPFLLLEIRQDLIDTEEKARDWGERLRCPMERSIERLRTELAAKGGEDRPTFAAGIRPARRIEPTLYSVGVEEEYHLVNKETGQVEPDPPTELFKRLESVPEMMISGEFYRFQVEIGTRPCRSLSELRDNIARLRKAVADIAGDYDLAPIAAGTHPTTRIEDQLVTEKPRYQLLRQALAYPARRLLTCGMHVHAGFEFDGVEDEALKIDMFGQIRYFLPYFLALSTSSPFWHSRPTDMLSYRLSVFHELKNTGLPPVFSNPREYDDFVEEALALGVTPDKSMLWWDVRPNTRYPTLEMRIMDVCTRLDDAMAVSALYLCTLSMLTRLRAENKSWRVYDDTLIRSNVWEAQKRGANGTMVDLARHASVPFAELYDDLVGMIEPEIEAYECADMIAHGRTIIENGTSADEQLRIFRDAATTGDSDEAAFGKVIQWLIDETVKV